MAALLCWLNEVFLYRQYWILGQLINPSVLLLSDFRSSSFSSCFSAVAFIDTLTAAHASLSAKRAERLFFFFFLGKAWCLIQSLTVDHMITNKSKHFPNEHKSVRFFSSSKMCQAGPSLQLTVYQQHLDFHHTDITCSLIARTTNTLSFPLSLTLCLEGENCYKGTRTCWSCFFYILPSSSPACHKTAEEHLKGVLFWAEMRVEQMYYFLLF